MTREAVISMRLYSQGLSDKLSGNPSDVVSHFGAIQSQDYAMALRAIDLRLKNPGGGITENAIISGEILRTHILRPTWHFVSRNDIRWMMKLAAPNVRKATQYLDKKEGLTDELYKKVWKVIELQFKEAENLSKEEIKSNLVFRKMEVNNLLLTQIIIRAELEMLLCSGEHKNEYALFDKRVPETPGMSVEESVFKLARIYFKSRGPATVKDFSWWSGLNLRDAKSGVNALGRELHSFMFDNFTFYHFEFKHNIPPECNSLLLPSYDEYTIGYSESRYIVLPAGLDKEKTGNGITKPLFYRRMR
jgi:Winged helix DNA-binding domain